MKWVTPAWAWPLYKWLASYTSSSKASAIMSTATPSSPFEVVALNVFWGSFGYFLHRYGNGQQWEHWNGAEIPNLPNPSLFVTTPKVGGTRLNFAAANYVVITQKFWVLNEQCQAYAQIVQLWRNRVPHTWQMNTGPSGFDNRASNL